MSHDDEQQLVVAGEHLPSAIAGLCSCMLVVLQALKQAAMQSGEARLTLELQTMQKQLRDLAAKSFPNVPWGKV